MFFSLPATSALSSVVHTSCLSDMFTHDKQTTQQVGIVQQLQTFPPSQLGSFVCFKLSMDGWMDGWVDGWMGGWMDGWMGN